MALSSAAIVSGPLRNNALLWYARTSWNNSPGTYYQAPQAMSTSVGYPVTPYQIVRFNDTRPDTERAIYQNGVLTTTNQPLIAYNDSTFLGDGTKRFRMRINYDAILYWLKNNDGNSGANPFPPVMRAGGILYYSSIPDTITTPTGNMPTTTQAQRDQRFWKEYIDYVLGYYEYNWSSGDPVLGTGSRGYDNTVMTKAGYGWDIGIDESAVTGGFKFPVGASSNQVVINVRPNGTTDTRYMNYRDSPMRPRTRYWFGPLTMIDFIENYNYNNYTNTAGQVVSRFWLPGTAHQAPMWQLKVGVQTVIGDVRNNHPNDYLAVVGFSVPAYNNGPSGGTNAVVSGYFNSVLSPLSPLFNNNYKRMVNSIWFPKTVINSSPYTEINPFNSAGMATVPRAIKGTCSPMAFALAYNQFSGETTMKNYNPAPAPDYEAGGNGRNGAQRLIIFETDGVASATCFLLGQESSGTHLVSNQHKSYFKVRWRDSGGTPEYPDGCYGPVDDAVSQTKTFADIITSKTSDTVPGFATNTKPVTIHCIAFGSLFDLTYTDSATVAARDKALGLLQYAQYKGGTQPTAATALESYKIINQTNYTARIEALRQAFSRCMQDAVTVTIIR